MLQTCLILDHIATRYHLLPSQVLEQADTLDYLVMDVAISWHRAQQEAAETGSGQKAVPNLPVNKLQDMIERVRNR